MGRGGFSLPIWRATKVAPTPLGEGSQLELKPFKDYK